MAISTLILSTLSVSHDIVRRNNRFVGDIIFLVELIDFSS